MSPLRRLCICVPGCSSAPLRVCASVSDTTSRPGSKPSGEEIIATLYTSKPTNPGPDASERVEERRRPQRVDCPIIVRTTSRLMRALAKYLLVVIEESASSDTGESERPGDLACSASCGQASGSACGGCMGDDRASDADTNRVQTLAGTAPVPFHSGHVARAHQ
jgi:hypothetical protein